MKLGLLTAAFPRMRLERVASWASDNGFEMLEVACWPAAGGERRRYAGVSHIDVAQARRRARCATSSTGTGSRSPRSPTTRTTSIPTRASGATRTPTCGR